METISDKIFARKLKNGNYDILYTDDGSPVSSIDADVWPVGSVKSARYPHERIELTEEQVAKLGIQFES